MFALNSTMKTPLYINTPFIFLIAIFLTHCKNETGDTMTHIEYYPNGNIKLVYTTKNGKLNGLRTEYYLTRKVKSQENWCDGIENGAAYLYYPNGNIKIRGSFLRGEKSGCWFEYYDGNVVRTFREYLIDSISNAKPYLNRYLDFDSIGNADLNVLSLYWEAHIIDSVNKQFLKIDIAYVPANSKYRIIYKSNSDTISDTIDCNNVSPVIIPINSRNKYIFGDLQCYTPSYELNGEMIFDSYDSYFDSRKLSCNLDFWPSRYIIK